VTAEDVLDVAQELFSPGWIGLTVLSPTDGIKITQSDLVC
jgi:hypothetical protein